MTIPDYFKHLGLSSEKATLYLTLLNSGPQTAISLAKLSGIKRTYVYHLSQELAKENLIKLSQKGRTTFFTALSPDTLLARAEERQTQARLAMAGLESAIPDLQSKYRLSDTRPTVSYFEGIEGVKKVYKDTLTAKTPILALVETNEVETEIYKWVTAEYVHGRILAKIPVQAIVTTGDKTTTYTKKDKDELRETKTVSSKDFPFEQEINIYDDKVAIINHKSGSKLLGIIISDPTIATTFRSWFNLTWGKL